MDIQLSIRIALARSNIRACQLAEGANISKGGLSEVMSGKVNPSLKYVEKLANEMGYKVSDFIALGEK